MKRVYYIWFLRRLFSQTMAKIVAITLVLWQLTYSVSFSSVLNNLPGKFDVAGNFRYLLSAAQNTESAVQIYLTLFVLLTGWIFMENTIFKNNSNFRNTVDRD